MARSKEFDPTTALDKAMLLFWQKGYTATSVADLVDATGVQRYGLYSTFGDKHELFLHALDRYLDVAVGAMVTELDEPEAGWAAIEAFFERLQMVAQTEPGKYGCLMCNSSIELGDQDAAVAERMNGYEARVAGLFSRAVAQAQADGALGLGVEAGATGRYLLGIAIGFFGIAQSPMSTTARADYLTIALNGLKALAQS